MSLISITIKNNDKYLNISLFKVINNFCFIDFFNFFDTTQMTFKKVCKRKMMNSQSKLTYRVQKRGIDMNYAGEKFLLKLYNDMYNDKNIKHSSTKSDNKYGD